MSLTAPSGTISVSTVMEILPFVSGVSGHCILAKFKDIFFKHSTAEAALLYTLRDEKNLLSTVKLAGVKGPPK